MGFVRQSKYIFPWILRFIFGKKQKYFWIRQKYIETSVSNPPSDELLGIYQTILTIETTATYFLRSNNLRIKFTHTIFHIYWN